MVTDDAPALSEILSTPERRLIARLFDPRVTYGLTRFWILRLLALVYLTAFLVAYTQLVPLVGHDGILPADQYLDRIAKLEGSRGSGAWATPSLFWLVGTSDAALRGVSAAGVVLSLAVLAGATNALVQLALWVLYLSIVHVGQLFYGYGWEAQLLETGFLAVFLCPLRSLRPLPARSPPVVVIWLFRWLIVRVMLGAGLVKLRGDPCWRDLTCLAYHYETQPIPSPVSALLHRAPLWFHELGVSVNHTVELVVPFFVQSPRNLRHVAGVALVAFQVFLIVSGNLSFLNWLTIVPALACFDDHVWARVWPGRSRASPLLASEWHRRASYVLAFVVGLLSITVVANLLSPSQVMNASYDRFELVGTYGAFGVVSRKRFEVVLEGTSAESIDDGTEWREYQLPCKPGDPARRPCVITPYHHRLDWQMWFLPLADESDWPEDWFVHLASMLLDGNRKLAPLFAVDPFPDTPPRWVRAVVYEVRFTRAGEPGWWVRERVGEYLRPVRRDDPDLRELMRRRGWN